MKKMIGMLLVLACFFQMQGQVTGHLGKKFIVKTNIVNGRFLGFNSADFEYVVGRKLSVIAGFQTFNYGRSEKGLKIRTGIIKPLNGKDEYREISILTNGETKGWVVSMGIRRYFDAVIPAPWGFYMEASVGIGAANFSDYNLEYKYAESGYNFSSTEFQVRKPVKNVGGSSSVLFFEIPSLGYQGIYKRWVTLDSKIGIQGQYCNLPEEMLGALEHNYYARTNTVSMAYNKLALGLCVYVKIGLLLF